MSPLHRCPNASITVAAIAFGTTLLVVNPHLGSRLAYEGTDKMLGTAPAQDAAGSKQSVIAWDKPGPADKIQKNRYAASALQRPFATPTAQCLHRRCCPGISEYRRSGHARGFVRHPVFSGSVV